MKILFLIESEDGRSKKGRYSVSTNGGRYYHGWFRKMTNDEIVKYTNKIKQKQQHIGERRNVNTKV